MSDIEKAEGVERRAPQSSFTDNPRLPVDGGMSSLGLLMQLGAVVMGCYNLFMVMIALSPAVPGRLRMLLLLGAALGVARNIVHYAAGLNLSASSVYASHRALKYVHVSVVQSVLLAVLIVVTLPGTELSFGFAALIVLLAWPAVVRWAVKRPASRELYMRAAEGELDIKGPNRGIQGAGALMTAMGIVGVVIGTLFVVMALSAETGRMGLLGILWIVLAFVLAARSVLHTRAGIVALRGATPYMFYGRVRHYVSLASASVAILVIGAFVTMVEVRTPMLLLQMVVVTVLFAAWPVIINGFVKSEWVLFALVDVDSDDDDTGFALAPDRGLTALGYVVLGSGAFALAGAIGSLIATGGVLSSLPGVDMRGGLGPSWWYLNLPASVLTLWAGYQIVTMSDKLKAAAIAYAVVMGGITLWGLVEQLDFFDNFRTLNAPAVLEYLMVAASVVVALVIPVLTAILVVLYRTPEQTAD